MLRRQIEESRFPHLHVHTLGVGLFLFTGHEAGRSYKINMVIQSAWDPEDEHG